MEGQNYFTLKEVKLHNHCPECFSNEGLEITFRQRFVETPFYKAITDDTRHDIYCNTCDTPIYPIQWTDDLEQVIAYQKRAATPKNPSFKLTRLSWGMISALVAIALGIGLFLGGLISI